MGVVWNAVNICFKLEDVSGVPRNRFQMTVVASSGVMGEVDRAQEEAAAALTVQTTPTDIQ